MKYASIWVSLCLLSGQLTGQQTREHASALEKGFRSPPIEARPRALWPWVNGNYSLSQITYELEQARSKGMGGFDIWDVGTMVDPDSVVPAGPPFLGNESVTAIAHAIREADRLGLELGLTISSSWNAGGSWVQPEHAAMGLFRSDTIVSGPGLFSAPVDFPVIPYLSHRSTLHDSQTGKPVYYREVAVVAHPYTSDSILPTLANVHLLTKPGASPGSIEWQVPEGQWRIVRYVCAPTGQPLAIPSPNSKGLMLDHFSADAQRSNLGYIFGRLLPVTGPLKNSSLKYLYADSYEVNSAVWTPALPAEFQQRRGYSMDRFLPILDGFRLSNRDSSESFMFDFRKTLSDLIIENHYKLGREICEQHGIGFCAEAGGPGPPIHNVPFEDLKALGALTIPRGEFWNKHPQLDLLQIIKGIASAAHIYNQKFVEAESFTSVWLWQEGPAELKPLADRAMCEGLNRFVYHTFPHTPPESGVPGWVYNFGTLINTTNGWWPKSDGFHHYLARSGFLLQQGNFVGDVAFYYGDAAPNFVSPKSVHPTPGEGFDYDVINTDILVNKLSVRNNRLQLPHGQSYQVLVLPGDQKMDLQVARKLLLLIRAGATIIGSAPKTTYSLTNDLNSHEELQKIVSQIWGEGNSSPGRRKVGKGTIWWGYSLPEVLKALNIIPDLISSGTQPRDIDFIHRVTGNENIYFIRNTTGHAVSSVFTARVADGMPELWDATTGAIYKLPVTGFDSRSTSFPLFLPAHGSVFIVFRKSARSVASKEIASTLADSMYEWRTTAKGIVKLDTVSSFPSKLSNWQLRFEQPSQAPPVDSMSTLKDLSQSENEGVRHFSGLVSYRTNFTIDSNFLKENKAVFLELGDLREVADVYVNGIHVGQLWHPPFETDISSSLIAGENSLVVDVVNTINNRLVGEGRQPRAARSISSNITRLPNAWMKPFAEAPLLPAGLIGPVRLRTGIYILR